MTIPQKKNKLKTKKFIKVTDKKKNKPTKKKINKPVKKIKLNDCVCKLNLWCDECYGEFDLFN